jgi:hypothetical protein
VARPGFLGGNAAKNVQVVGGVGLFVQVEGDSRWIDLGAMSDIELEPATEFLEYNSHRRGTNALVKRILTNRALTMNATLEEVNPDNLRFAFLGGSPISNASVNILESAVLTSTASDTVILPEVADDVLQVASSDGQDDLAATPSDPSNDLQTDGITLNIAPGTGAGVEVHVIYHVAQTTDSESMEILESSLLQGIAQFRIRNTQGGLAQVYEMDSIDLAPNGAVPIPQEEIQSLPVTLTVREKNGKFGRIYTQTVTV